MSKKVNNQASLFTADGTVLRQQSAAHFVREAMKRYGEEVILNRSLPRLEDGLRPVQRLLFWSCMDLARTKFMKSAKIASHCTGSYSPHGEKAAYDSLVRMVCERYPLVEGQGNFGSATTSAASARYTESRISPFGRKLVADLEDFKIIPYEKNYDDTLEQPKYLPALLPNILLNPGSGIAVGITSKIAGFNLGEVAQAVQTYLTTGNILTALKKINGPDVGFCKILSPKEEIMALLTTGEGTLEYECAHRIEEKRGKKLLILTGYVPEFSITGFLSKCEQMQDEELVEAVRNETSETNGDRIVVEFKDSAVYDKLLKLLRKKVSYKFNVLVETGGILSPRLMNVGSIIEGWVGVRRAQVKETIAYSVRAQEEVLRREKAKLRAISDKKALFRAIESDLDFEEALKKELGLEPEDAAVVAKMAIESLRKANVDKVKEQIAKLEATLAETKNQLSTIDDVIKGQIQDFMKWVKAESPDMLARKTELP